MVPRIDHIELTVADLDRAEPFYDELLPLLGFDLDPKTWDNIPKHEFRCVDYGSPAFDLTLICPRPALVGEAVCRRKPVSLHHLAFGVDRREARSGPSPARRSAFRPGFIRSILRTTTPSFSTIPRASSWRSCILTVPLVFGGEPHGFDPV